MELIQGDLFGLTVLSIERGLYCSRHLPILGNKGLTVMIQSSAGNLIINIGKVHVALAAVSAFMLSELLTWSSHQNSTGNPARRRVPILR